MAVWMEFRCEGRCDPGAAGSGWGEAAAFRCQSSGNNGPMGMAHDTVESVRRVLRELGEEARKDGWKRLTEGWTCPQCIARRAAQATPTLTEGAG
jgi:hypothetical protein